MTALRPPLSSLERLNLLYRLSQAFNSSLNLDEVLNRVMDEVIAILKAERGFVMLRGPDGNLAFRVARGLDQRGVSEPQFQISRKVLDQVISEGRPILTDDARLDERFNMRQSVLDLGLRSILCVPLVTQGEVAGAIYVDNRLMAGIFTRDDLDLLTAIAANAAIAIENARLYQVAVEKGRMEQELVMAREVQAGLLPESTPEIPGWLFAARWQPAREVAGDYYDFIVEDGQVGLLIADVSDKGMPAALFMGLSRAMVRARLELTAPAESFRAANRLLCAEARASGMFVTLFYGGLNTATGELTYVNAGHNPPLLYRGRARQFVPLTRTGMALGVLEDAPYEQRSVTLEPGDFLFCYTDGVTDALNPHGLDFGLERLEALLTAGHALPPAGLLAELVHELAAFTGQAVPFDDITLLAVKRE